MDKKLLQLFIKAGETGNMPNIGLCTTISNFKKPYFNQLLVKLSPTDEDRSILKYEGKCPGFWASNVPNWHDDEMYVFNTLRQTLAAMLLVIPLEDFNEDEVDDTVVILQQNTANIQTQFKVVSVSSNTNSFGLHGVILVEKSGLAYEVGISSWCCPKKDEMINAIINDKGDLISLSSITYEIPRKLPPPDENTLAEIFK